MSPAEPSTEEPDAPDHDDENRTADEIIQNALPAIAHALVALAKQGNTTAITLAFRLGDPATYSVAQVLAAMINADDDTLSEIAALLTKRPVV